MTTLNLFPARVAIGTVKTEAGEMPVMMTPEFFRALTDLLTRVGGPSGTNTGDIELMAVQSMPPAVDLSQFADIAALQMADSPAAVAQLAQDVSDALAVQLVEARALVAELRKQVVGLEVVSGYTDPFRVNWERPGKIGSLTPNSGAFTTLTASAAVTLSPANANVTISPTGTGTVGIAPNTAGSINNMTIGGTTPLAGGFTTLTTSGNAGIGLTASFRLHVQRGSSGISSVFQGSGSSVQLYLEHDETNLINYVGSSGSSSRPLGFKSGNTELARLTATGNLLIGTTTDGMAASGSIAIAKDFAHRGANIGFFSTAPINKLTVTGSRGGNVALASLLTQLNTYGFITDSSTA